MTIDPGARDPLPDLDRYLRAVMRLRIETVRRMAAMAEHEPSLDLELARRAAERAIRNGGRREIWGDVREAPRRWALPNYPRASVESDRLGGFVAAGISWLGLGRRPASVPLTRRPGSHPRASGPTDRAGANG